MLLRCAVACGKEFSPMGMNKPRYEWSKKKDSRKGATTQRLGAKRLSFCSFLQQYNYGWQAEKLDDTPFYRKHFQSFADSKSVDIVSFKPDGEDLWLLEVKDYRINPRTKNLDLFKEVAIKVRDTLALLYLAKSKPEISIHRFASEAVGKTTIRVVLHMEQPANPSRLYPLIVERGNVRIKLQQTLLVVDPRALFCEMSAIPPDCHWQVTPNP